MAYNGKDARSVLGFLKDIAANNNREWFTSHREEYDRARACFEEFTRDMILAVSSIDESVKYLTVKDCTYRFYRDTRFSQDKSPYKRHFGCYINPMGKKSLHGGYYIHWQPGECMIAVGCYELPTELMNKVRLAIRDNLDEYVSIVESPDFKAMFPVVGEDRFKVVPRGFKKDEPCAWYIMPKSFVVFKRVDDNFFGQEDAVERVLDIIKVAKPFMDFVNDTVDDYIS